MRSDQIPNSCGISIPFSQLILVSRISSRKLTTLAKLLSTCLPVTTIGRKSLSHSQNFICTSFLPAPKLKIKTNNLMRSGVLNHDLFLQSWVRGLNHLCRVLEGAVNLTWLAFFLTIYYGEFYSLPPPPPPPNNPQ